MKKLIHDAMNFPAVEDLKKRMQGYRQNWENNKENVHTDMFWDNVTL